MEHSTDSVRAQVEKTEETEEVGDIESESQLIYYDIPLSKELQDVTIKLCSKYNVDPIIAFALMQKESTYQVDVVSKTNDYGIMQINKINHEWLSEELGITDFLDPNQNIEAGLYMLGDYLEKYGLHQALMSYNMGEKGARKAISRGNPSSEYSRDIEEIMSTIRLREEN